MPGLLKRSIFYLNASSFSLWHSFIFSLFFSSLSFQTNKSPHPQGYFSLHSVVHVVMLECSLLTLLSLLLVKKSTSFHLSNLPPPSRVNKHYIRRAYSVLLRTPLSINYKRKVQESYLVTLRDSMIFLRSIRSFHRYLSSNVRHPLDPSFFYILLKRGASSKPDKVSFLF